MRLVAMFIVIVLAGTAGFAVFTRDNEPAHESAAPLTMADPLPQGSVVASVTGMDDAPLIVSAGSVIELTYRGQAADGHEPCARLDVLVGGRRTTTHWLGSAFNITPGGDIWGDATWDRAVEGSDIEIVCPAMDMIGAGPERFRLPLVMPDGATQLCIGNEFCVDLQVVS